MPFCTKETFKNKRIKNGLLGKRMFFIVGILLGCCFSQDKNIKTEQAIPKEQKRQELIPTEQERKKFLTNAKTRIVRLHIPRNFFFYRMLTKELQSIVTPDLGKVTPNYFDEEFILTDITPKIEKMIVMIQGSEKAYNIMRKNGIFVENKRSKLGARR